MPRIQNVCPKEVRKAGEITFKPIPVNQYKPDYKKEVKKYGVERLKKMYYDMLVVREFETMLNLIKTQGVYQGTEYNHPGPIMRTAYEGLALLYADTYGTLEQLSGKKMEVLRIVGGGCQNKTLSQFAADATGRKVVTGPIEATAIGNLIVQMLAMGDIASLDEGRAIIRDSFAHESKTYHPQNVDAWKAALGKWRSICR